MQWDDRASTSAAPLCRPASRNVAVRLVPMTRRLVRVSRRWSPDHDTGVGDDGVQPAEAVEREAHGLAHNVLVRNIALHGGGRPRPAAEMLDQPHFR
jgi:hypothetical protein